MRNEDGLLTTNVELAALDKKFASESIVPTEDARLQRREVLSLFVSDAHLGRHDCKSEKLTLFLDLIIVKGKEINGEIIGGLFSLLGDIVDFWFFHASRLQNLGRIFRDDTKYRTGKRAIQFGLHLVFRQFNLNLFRPSEAQAMRWPQTHNDVVQKILRTSRDAAQAIFVPGNHDEVWRALTNNLHRMGAESAQFLNGVASELLRQTHSKSPALGKMHIVQENVYVALGGENLHVCHGDRFDPPYQKSRFLGITATRLFHGRLVPLIKGLGFRQAADRLTEQVNGLESKDKAFYDRYADFLDKENEKIKAYNAANPDQTPRALLRGGIHGHKHCPGIHWHRGYVFMDCGDWVSDSHCTALVEHTDGTWQIMTVNRTEGIVPHPVTPEPIELFPKQPVVPLKDTLRSRAPLDLAAA